jgi:hypothetical protein
MAWRLMFWTRPRQSTCPLPAGRLQAAETSSRRATEGVADGSGVAVCVGDEVGEGVALDVISPEAKAAMRVTEVELGVGWASARATFTREASLGPFELPTM